MITLSRPESLSSKRRLLKLLVSSMYLRCVGMLEFWSGSALEQLKLDLELQKMDDDEDEEVAARLACLYSMVGRLLG